MKEIYELISRNINNPWSQTVWSLNVQNLFKSVLCSFLVMQICNLRVALLG